jgi:hypothetical protein
MSFSETYVPACCVRFAKRFAATDSFRGDISVERLIQPALIVEPYQNRDDSDG